jgi:large subunit ribosomal protein L22
MATAPTQPQTVRAQAKWVRMSARKGRVVAEHIRGRSVPEARAVLAFTQRAAAREIEKVLASAVANAEANHGLNGDELVVHAALVDDGPTLKRWRARARGRVARIKKRTCHITLVLRAPAAHEGLAVAEAPTRAAKPEPEGPEAAETDSNAAASSTAKPKSTTTSEPTETASAQAKPARRKKTEE